MAISDKSMMRSKIVMKGDFYYKEATKQSLDNMLITKSTTNKIKFKVMSVDETTIEIARYLLPTHYTVDKISSYLTHKLSINDLGVIIRDNLGTNRLVKLTKDELRDYIKVFLNKSINKDTYKSQLDQYWIDYVK